MALEAFVEKKWRQQDLDLVDTCNEILASYREKDLKVILRQLYYRLIARNYFANDDRNYDYLGRVVTNARLCGLMDWDAIEDLGRQPAKPVQFNGIADLVESACNSFRLDRWEGQSHYVELWTEKLGLTSVLLPIAEAFHIPFCANKGYASITALYEASKRIHAAHERSLIPVILYLGDHDASGLDMDRDIRERLETLGVPKGTFLLRRVALTIEQVRRYRPPRNPAKVTDTRSPKYVAEFGHYSWEVDALDPEDMEREVRRAIAPLVDMSRMNKVIAREDKHREAFRATAVSLAEKIDPAERRHRERAARDVARRLNDQAEETDEE